jgi:hypothetical protein
MQRGTMKAIKKLLWVAGGLIVVAGIGFWARPVSYYNEATYLREFLSGVESRSVQVAGHRVHYLVEGPEGGPVVVLVHGLGGRAEDWLNLALIWSRPVTAFICPICPATGAAKSPRIFPTRCAMRPRQWLGFSMRWD